MTASSPVPASAPLQSVIAEIPRPSGSTVLRIETRPDIMGPDVICLGLEHGDGAFEVLAELDGRYPSTEVACGMLGRVIGRCAVGGVATFDWFDYEPLVEGQS